jgi:hypothetical protein
MRRSSNENGLLSAVERMQSKRQRRGFRGGRSERHERGIGQPDTALIVFAVVRDAALFAFGTVAVPFRFLRRLIRSLDRCGRSLWQRRRTP